METNHLSLSKGVYDLLKDHLKVNNKLSNFNKNKLSEELKTAKILPSKSLPEDVVSINTLVEITDLETQVDLNFALVSPSEAKIKLNKLSALSPIGVALLGYSEGNEVQWEMPEGLKTFKINRIADE